MSKILYALSAVVVIGGGFFLYNKSSSSSSQKISQSQQVPVATNAVSFDGSAFFPSAIEIKLGDTVTFTNKSSAGMWVASAPHPTHTDYPAFDAKKSYSTGESFKFTFDRVGSWKYHNHMNPSVFGVVIVK